MCGRLERVLADVRLSSAHESAEAHARADRLARKVGRGASTWGSCARRPTGQEGAQGCVHLGLMRAQTDWPGRWAGVRPPGGGVRPLGVKCPGALL
eukprot:152066-Chlamydomonas_euryale.AAC.1